MNHETLFRGHDPGLTQSAEYLDPVASMIGCSGRLLKKMRFLPYFCAKSDNNSPIAKVTEHQEVHQLRTRRYIISTVQP